MGFEEFDYKKTSEVFKEISKKALGFSKVHWASLNKGKEMFLEEKKDKEIQGIPVDSLPVPAKRTKAYPYLLQLLPFNDGYKNIVLSRDIKGLRMVRNAMWIKISPNDAEKLNLENDDPVTVVSIHGKAKRFVKIIEAIPEGIFQMTSYGGDGDSLTAQSLIGNAFLKTASTHVIPVKIQRGE